MALVPEAILEKLEPMIFKRYIPLVTLALCTHAHGSEIKACYTVVMHV